MKNKYQLNVKGYDPKKMLILKSAGFKIAEIASNLEEEKKEKTVFVTNDSALYLKLEDMGIKNIIRGGILLNELIN